MSGPRPPKSLRGMDGDWPCPDEKYCLTQRSILILKLSPQSLEKFAEHNVFCIFSTLYDKKTKPFNLRCLNDIYFISNYSCGNMNFARRTQCNKCGIGKLISVVHEV